MRVEASAGLSGEGSDGEVRGETLQNRGGQSSLAKQGG